MAKINLKPTNKQHEAWQRLEDEVTKYLLFGGGAGGGKTFAGTEWLITNCYRYPRTRWFIARDTLKKIRQTNLQEFHKVVQHHNIPKNDFSINSQSGIIEFNNGSRIDFLQTKPKPSDPIETRFGSMNFTGGWIEEAGEVKFRAFDVLKTRIGRHYNDKYDLRPAKMFITCNPERNWLYRKFYKPWKKGELEDTKAFIQSLYTDNPYTREQYEKDLSEIENEILKQRLKQGEWEYEESPTTLFKYFVVEDIFTNNGIQTDDPDKYISVDVARLGEDDAIICIWYDYQVVDYQIIDKCKNDELADIIREWCNREHIRQSHVVIDTIGTGTGVVDSLDNAVPFKSNAKPVQPDEIKHKEKQEKDLYKENYKSLRDQCYFKLSKIAKDGKLGVTAKEEKHRERITEELRHIKEKDAYKENKRKVISKEEIKKELGYSPDWADTLMMRMYFELKDTSPDRGVIWI